MRWKADVLVTRTTGLPRCRLGVLRSTTLCMAFKSFRNSIASINLSQVKNFGGSSFYFFPPQQSESGKRWKERPPISMQIIHLFNKSTGLFLRKGRQIQRLSPWSLLQTNAHPLNIAIFRLTTNVGRSGASICPEGNFLHSMSKRLQIQAHQKVTYVTKAKHLNPDAT